MSSIERLISVVAQLRDEGGCDWDRAQTPQSMRAYLLEEAHEVLDAIDRDHAEDLRGELGDLLFHIVMLARMHEERGAFRFEDVASDVADKMQRRHPHIFGDATTPPDWQEMKAREREARGEQTPASILEGIPRSLPALSRAHLMTERASAVGFDWPDRRGPRAKLDEELAELDEALDHGEPDAITGEFGDLLFTMVNLGRFLPTGAEEALRVSTAKFERRFRAVEQACLDSGDTVSTTSASTLERHWDAAKEAEA